jgi:hypothetical protein
LSGVAYTENQHWKEQRGFFALAKPPSANVIQSEHHLRIRAERSLHCFIGIWVVVVKERVFVRSWSVEPNGWYRTFLKDPRGAIRPANHEIAVPAVRVRDERVRIAIDRAYLEKYNTRDALKYAKDLGSPKIASHNH